jgi:hypothetical protein
LHPAVALMYRQSLRSETWGAEFRSYWDLPADWTP